MAHTAEKRGKPRRSASTAIAPVLSEFAHFYKGLVNAPEYKSPDAEDWNRDDRFRVSSFPYCGLKHAFKRLRVDESEDEDSVTFGMKYYTSVGTQTHRYLQYVLGHGSRMLGRWKCVTRGCKGDDSLSFDNRCPVCGRPRDYEELTVTGFVHLTGHIDGVWRAADGRYYIIDYKTSSVRAIESNAATGYMPYKKNVAQIVAYAALLERHLNIKISGWILMYVARDRPMETVLPLGGMLKTRTKKTILKKIERWASDYGTVMNAKSFSQIKDLIANKPCATSDWYMSSAYHSAFGGCLLGTSGLCFKKDALMEIMQESWRDKPKDWLARKRPAYLDDPQELKRRARPIKIELVPDLPEEKNHA